MGGLEYRKEQLVAARMNLCHKKSSVFEVSKATF